MRVLFETLYDRFYDGWCIAARAYARAMRAAGVEVHLHSWLPLITPTNPSVLAEVGDMMKPCEEKWDVYLWSGTFGGPGEGQTLALKRILNFRQRFETPVAFYTMFERTNVQPELVPLVNELDGVLVPCSANLRALERAGVTNAKFIPVPFFENEQSSVDPLCLRCLPPPKHPPRVFYWIGRWEPRKAPHRLVQAFLRAFTPNDPVELVLKVGPSPWRRSEYAPPETVIEESAKLTRLWSPSQAASRITVVRDLLSDEEMVALHKRGDVYVSASHGEGIDMPAFAAKLAGRRVVTVASGGPEDFVTDDDIVVRATGEVEMPEYDGIWGPGSTAVNYSFADLVTALQTAAFDSRPPKPATELVLNHDGKRVGLQMRSWLEGLVRR